MRIRKPFVYPKTNVEALRYMRARYNEMDDSISQDLQKSQKLGVFPTCKKGCSHCCRQLVMAAPLEGMALLHFIQNEIPVDKQQRIIDRTKDWFNWREKELPRHISESKKDVMKESAAHYNFGPHCPLLEDGICTIYEVRPMACRVFYVTSDPRGCLPHTDPLYMPGIWKESDVGFNVAPITQRIRKDCLKHGVDAKLDGKLIPEWIKEII
jgi:Fe-S-cluster containining protein